MKFFGRGMDSSDTNESFVLLFWNWTLVGTRLVEPYRMNRLLYSAFCWSCLLTSPIVYMRGAAGLMKTATTSGFLTNMQSSLNLLVLPFKAIVTAFYMPRLHSVEVIFKRLDERYSSIEDFEQLRGSVNYCKWIFATFWIVYIMFGIATCLIGLFTHSQPLNAWFPFIDLIPNSTLKFWLHFICEVFLAFFLILNQVPNDGYPVIFIHALRTHIKLLMARISRLGTNPDFDDEQNSKELIDCIVSHQELLDIGNTVGTVVSLTIFMQFSLAAVILCVCMLNFSFFADPFNKVVTVIYYMCVSLQTIPTCYEASMLEAESAQLPSAIFHSNWLALDKSSRKLIIHFMQRTQNGITFMAMKLFQIDLRTNLSVAKFSLSLYAFMNSMEFGRNIKEKY